MSAVQIPTGEHYEGPMGALKKDSPWLASEDLADQQVRVVIKDVSLHRNVKFDKGRVEPKVAAIKFDKFEKRMVLNATNRKMLGMLFGMNTRTWLEQEVILWADPNVEMAGKRVFGLRIKEAPPLPKEPPCPLTNLPESWLGWSNEERGEHVATRGTDDLKKWWEWLPKAERAALAAKLPEWKATAEAAHTKA